MFRLLFLVAAFPLISFASIDDVDHSIPRLKDGDVLIERTGFSLVYDIEKKVPVWVGYELTHEEVEGDIPTLNRDEINFKKDPAIKESPSHRSYSNSGYNRGHMAPADDLSWSEDAFNDSFYTSNVVPQSPGLNQGIWLRLEEQVQEWAEEYNAVYVISGPVLTEPCLEILFQSICAPRRFFKVVLRTTTRWAEAIGFLMTQDDHEGDLRDFVVSIDDVEDLTGLDFFYQLSRATERRVESRSLVQRWTFPEVD